MSKRTGLFYIWPRMQWGTMDHDDLEIRGDSFHDVLLAAQVNSRSALQRPTELYIQCNFL